MTDPVRQAPRAPGLRELWELTRVRFLLFVREPEAMFWVFAFPLVLAAVLGFAFRSTGPPESVVGLHEGPGADGLAAALERVERLEVKREANLDELLVQLRSGAIEVLVLPGDPPTLRLDPARSESETARLRVERALELAASGVLEAEPPERYSLEPITERGSRYIDFLFPGLLGLNLMGTGMWSIGFAVAELRQKKVLRRMLVTPMRRSSFLLSFLLARLAFLVAEVVVLVGFGTWVLGVPFRAELFSFGLVTLVGAATFAGLGLLAATRVKTIQGASGMLNLVMMPMWLGSGVFFSYERFPEAVQPLLRALPLTALNDGLRKAMLDGRGLLDMGLELGVLLAWGLVSFVLALKIFRWE